MHTQHHPLVTQSVGTQRQLISEHYGSATVDQKVYLQASLHADEVPGMLVMHHLRGLLHEAELAGNIVGSIVLVPFANPIGLSQHLMRDHLGRFDLNSGENFNRHYPDFYDLVASRVEPLLGANEQENKAAIRQSLREAIAELPATTELQSLRRTLISLSCDADWVLDLHCDFEALMHLYVDTPYLDRVESLACFLGAETVLHATGSGGSAFDEAQSGLWYRLQDKLAPTCPIPLAGCGVTVELRGESDVTHDLARQDAQNLFFWMQSLGVILGDAPNRPEPLYQPTPLAGYEPVKAPCSGILVYQKALGEWVDAGETVAEIVDPMTREVVTVLAQQSGKLFARENRRFAVAGMDIGKIAGLTPYRTGSLLGA